MFSDSVIEKYTHFLKWVTKSYKYLEIQKYITKFID